MSNHEMLNAFLRDQGTPVLPGQWITTIDGLSIKNNGNRTIYVGMATDPKSDLYHNICEKTGSVESFTLPKEIKDAASGITMEQALKLIDYPGLAHDDTEEEDEGLERLAKAFGWEDCLDPNTYQFVEPTYQQIEKMAKEATARWDRALYGEPGELTKTDLPQLNVQFSGNCEHVWAETGFKKTWCRRCNADKPTL